MIKQCSNCKDAYESCHMRNKNSGFPCCNFWEPQKNGGKKDASTKK
jgi:hypothetical protein